MSKVHVVVVMGGPSAEHEVSLRSGREVLLHLDQSRYSIGAVVIDNQKKMYYREVAKTVPPLESFTNPGESSGWKGPYGAGAAEKIWKDCDVAFLALHGSFGEDGIFQGYLDTLGVPYTGSGVYASAVAMNKIASKYIYLQNGITVPPYSIYNRSHPVLSAEVISKTHGLPCFIKCPQSGSSRLLGRADSLEQLRALLKELSLSSEELLIETAIVGTEFSCGILEKHDGTLLALPPVEIRPVSSSFFDYNAKYAEGGSLEIVPAPFPEELLGRIKSIAMRVHLLLNCRGVSRTDMIVRDDTVYVLETNTLPGLTSASLLPKAFAAQGGTYAELLDILIRTAGKQKQV